MAFPDDPQNDTPDASDPEVIGIPADPDRIVAPGATDGPPPDDVAAQKEQTSGAARVDEPDAPVDDAVAPVDVDPVPVEETTAPVDVDPVPVDETTAPVDEPDVLVDVDPAPVDETATPVDEPDATVDDTAPPVDIDPGDEVIASAEDGGGPGHDGVPHADQVLMPDVTRPLDPSASDDDATHDHAPAATHSNADKPSRAPIIVGIALLALAGLAVAFFLLQGGSDEPAYTVYSDPVSRTDLQERLDGLVDADLIKAAGDIQDATPEQKSQLARPISLLITEDMMTKAAADDGLEVTDENVDERISQTVDESFGGDREAFDQAIAETGATLTEVKTQFRTGLLAEALIEGTGTTEPADEAAIQEFYDQQFADPVVSHLLTETEEEAQQARDRIEGGEEFAAVAQEVSVDAQSGQQGGRLGPLVAGQFVPEFEEAATQLQPGDLSEPVQTEFGYHVITLEAPPALDEVRDVIVQQLEQTDQAAQFQVLAERLDEEADVTIDPAFGNWTGLAEGGLVVDTATPPAAEPVDAPTQE